MSGSDWRDARVRHAEEALADAVHTADEIVADAEMDAGTGRAGRKPPPEPSEETPPPTILHDAW